MVGGVEPAYAGPDDDAVRVLLLAHDEPLTKFLTSDVLLNITTVKYTIIHL